MANDSVPIAVSGLGAGAADKIRAVIYANERLAHVPLAEILKLAVSAGASKGLGEGGACSAKGGFIRLGARTLLQYGFLAADTKGERQLHARFSLPFADSDYCPFISLCAAAGGSVFIAAESLQKTGFSIGFAAPPFGGGGVFWLALGLADL